LLPDPPGDLAPAVQTGLSTRLKTAGSFVLFAAAIGRLGMVFTLRFVPEPKGRPPR